MSPLQARNGNAYSVGAGARADCGQEEEETDQEEANDEEEVHDEVEEKWQ
jgi:hypothetical protein